jgi:hypothetical protein
MTTDGLMTIRLAMLTAREEELQRAKPSEAVLTACDIIDRQTAQELAKRVTGYVPIG